MKMTQREHALQIFQAALRAVDPYEAVRRYLRIDGQHLLAGDRAYGLADLSRIWVLGAGKASARMAQAVEVILGERIAGGVVNVKYGHTAPLQRVRLVECSHPVPDAAGVAGAEQIAAIAREAGPDDLVIAVISGGASALLPLPAAPVSLADKQATTQLLLESGADIHEMNRVRKHLSQVKGGQLARLAAPAQVISLLLSDVVGDDLDVIGSGPTVPDRSTFSEARAVLERRGIWDRVPAVVRERFTRGESGEIAETPKPGDAVFERTQNLIVASNRLAVEAARAEAVRLGYQSLVLSTFVEGEAREVARMHGAVLKEVVASGNPIPAPACLISGGETTVTIRGTGKGGRNQEFALAAALEIDGLPGVTLLSAGTDGSDGPTDATGALVSGETVRSAAARGFSARRHLDQNDAYPFFDASGELLRTGPTHTNVMDVRVMLVGSPFKASK